MIYPKIRKGYYEWWSTKYGHIGGWKSMRKWVRELPNVVFMEDEIIEDLKRLNKEDRDLMSIAERFKATINWESGTMVVKIDNTEETHDLNAMLQKEGHGSLIDHVKQALSKGGNIPFEYTPLPGDPC